MSADLRARFAAFQAQHPLQSRQVGGWNWQYIDAGRGQALVMLPGFFGVAGTDFQYVTAFEPARRVLSLTYPVEAASVGELVEALAAFLDALGLPRVDLLGGSYSGYVAQAFVRRCPGRVRKLVLAQTGAPRRRHAPLALGLAALFAITPQALLRRLMSQSMAYFLPGQLPSQSFWREYFAGLILSLSRRSIYHRFRVVLDYHLRWRFASADLAGWPGEILLLESDHDGLLSRQDTLLMRSLYPQARRACLPGDHIQSVDRPAAQIAAIEEFLGQGL